MAKVALITGSTSGIGLGIARALASKGRSILLTGFGIPTYVPTTYLAGDLSRDDDVIGICKKIHSQYPGGIDILVNNAGFQFVSRVEEFPLDKWTNMMSVMLTAPFLLTQNLLPGMRTKGWGRIINISSVHGHVASLNKAAYVTAKHGIQGFTKVVALETARSGVTCNALCPGWVQTELFEKQVDEISEQGGISWQDAKEVLYKKQWSSPAAT
nr:D-beta-hydroxybutyrate dehydrogenase-like [Lytechinus pictus]